MKNLEWNVMTFDHNANRFESYNILSPYFVDAIKKDTKKAVGRDAFAEEVKTLCMRRFWSKFEWELVLTEWTGRDNPVQKKVDVYDQLVLNWDRFIDYLWANLRDGESDG